jgi:hypothetical protein
MTASLPSSIQDVFERFVTTELTTVDRAGQPITWPVTPYYRRGGPGIDVTTGLGYPKKADDARANPLVALLFSDPTGSGVGEAPMVLVQGSAEVDDHDLEANRDRYRQESLEKLPGLARHQPPGPFKGLHAWYFMRIYIHVRPERVYVWRSGDSSQEPELYDAHMEEVRSGHSEEPERFHARPEGGLSHWDSRMRELGDRHRTAVLSIVCPDGFPFAVRVPVHVDEADRWIRIEDVPEGTPLQPGLACLTVHSHATDFSWQQNFHVRGDLGLIDGVWALVPHKVVGGLERPLSTLATIRENAAKALRFRRTARRELARRR